MRLCVKLSYKRRPIMMQMGLSSGVLSKNYLLEVPRIEDESLCRSWTKASIANTLSLNADISLGL